jgi:hypothetical protein
LSRPSLLLLHCSMYVQPTRLQKSLALWRSTAFFTRRSVLEQTTIRLFIAASAIAVSANLQQEGVSQRRSKGTEVSNTHVIQVLSCSKELTLVQSNTKMAEFMEGSSARARSVDDAASHSQHYNKDKWVAGDAARPVADVSHSRMAARLPPLIFTTHSWRNKRDQERSASPAKSKRVLHTCEAMPSVGEDSPRNGVPQILRTSSLCEDA